MVAQWRTSPKRSAQSTRAEKMVFDSRILLLRIASTSEYLTRLAINWNISSVSRIICFDVWYTISDISYMLVVTLDETPSSTLTKVRYYAILRQTQLCQINGEALVRIFKSWGWREKTTLWTSEHSILTLQCKMQTSFRQKILSEQNVNSLIFKERKHHRLRKWGWNTRSQS